MRSHVRNSPTAEHAVGGMEVVDIGYGRLGDAGPVADVEPLLLIESAADPRHVDGPRPGLPSLRRFSLALTFTFILGLVAGILASQAHDETGRDLPRAIELGSANPEGPVVQLSASFGVTSVTVPVHNAGSEDVTVHSFSLPGWQEVQLGSASAREPVTVPAGQTQMITTGVDLDCSHSRPMTPTVVEVRLRTNELGVVNKAVPLATPARELVARWEQFCAS